MARRKKPQITGSDPSYDHRFERFRPIPNDMPPDVVVPGVEPDTQPTSRKQPDKKPARRAAKNPDPPVVVPKAEQSKAPVERQTTMDAAVTVEQAARLAGFTSKGLKMKDIVTLAGRRATERFKLSPAFIEKPQADRLPMKQGYHTSKRLPADILDAMRQKHDPLGISSDPAMVRGQFEILFWACLDEVIEELKQRY